MRMHVVTASILGAALCITGRAYGLTTTYTDQLSFLGALPGATHTVTFDAQSAGISLPSGTNIGGMTLNYSISGGPPPSALDAMVTNDFLTTSGANYLGLNDPGNYNLFIAGDEFSLAFDQAVSAVGMYFVSGDPLFANDISIVTSSGTAFNGDAVDIAFPDGGLAYYVGLVSDTLFASASVQFNSAAVGTFLYSVDDITTSTVPIPAAGWLFGSGLVALIRIKRMEDKS